MFQTTLIKVKQPYHDKLDKSLSGNRAVRNVVFIILRGHVRPADSFHTSWLLPLLMPNLFD